MKKSNHTINYILDTSKNDDLVAVCIEDEKNNGSYIGLYMYGTKCKTPEELIDDIEAVFSELDIRNLRELDPGINTNHVPVPALACKMEFLGKHFAFKIVGEDETFYEKFKPILTELLKNKPKTSLTLYSNYGVNVVEFGTSVAVMTCEQNLEEGSPVEKTLH